MSNQYRPRYAMEPWNDVAVFEEYIRQHAEGLDPPEFAAPPPPAAELFRALAERKRGPGPPSKLFRAFGTYSKYDPNAPFQWDHWEQNPQDLFRALGF